jgi:hypothetical protein
MRSDNTGVYTDSAEFIDAIPECTNISVGYYREHTNFEHQDIEHLIKLCIAVTKIDWETLPVQRDKTKVEYKSYSYSSYSNKGFSSYDYDSKKYGNEAGFSTYDSWSGWDKSPSRRKKYKKEYGYYDDFYFEDEEKYDKYSYDLDTGEEKVGRSYYNSIDNDITDSRSNPYVNKYSSLREMVYDDRLTDAEVLTLKDQYFDLTDREQLETYIDLRNQAASL